MCLKIQKWEELLGICRGKNNKDMIIDYYELFVCLMWSPNTESWGFTVST